MLKIAVTSPISWPYVRRGNRFSFDLAKYLARRGHEVYYISTKPGISRIKEEEGIHIELHRQCHYPFLNPLNVLELSAPGVLFSFLKKELDVVQTTLPPDAFAASWYRLLRGVPFVHYLFGCEPLYFQTLFGRQMFKRVLKKASLLLAPSDFVHADLKKEFHRMGKVVFPPVDTDRFFPAPQKDLSTIRIATTCSLDTPRKRVPLLIKAFEKLNDFMPNTVLQLVGHTTPEATRAALLSVNKKAREAIEINEIKDDNNLAGVYRNAAITVVPSLHEPFGMVVTESLASGTPVVAALSGAMPETIVDDSIGVLFDPASGPAEICQALLKGIELSGDNQTSSRCRAYIEKKYSWHTLGPQYEKIYYEITGQG